MITAALLALVLACIWTVVGIAVLVGMAVYLVRSRREEADVPEDPTAGDYYDTDDAVSRCNDRAVMDYQLADDVEVCRRLEPMYSQVPELAALPRQLEDLYLIEVDR